MKLVIKKAQEYIIELPDSTFLKDALGAYFRINQDQTVTVVKDRSIEEIKAWDLEPTIRRSSISATFGWMTESQIKEIQRSIVDEFNNVIHRTLNTITNE
jgi:hypothetical protein